MKQIKKMYNEDHSSKRMVEWIRDGEGERRCIFHVERYIWIDDLVPKLRVRLAEDATSFVERNQKIPIMPELHELTYIPTGKQCYDNTLRPPTKNIVFEYELEEYVEARGHKKSYCDRCSDIVLLEESNHDPFSRLTLFK
jgi:hypothetical protein